MERDTLHTPGTGEKTGNVKKYTYIGNLWKGQEDQQPVKKQFVPLIATNRQEMADEKN
jgi:hypothetical protein